MHIQGIVVRAENDNKVQAKDRSNAIALLEDSNSTITMTNKGLSEDCTDSQPQSVHETNQELTTLVRRKINHNPKEERTRGTGMADRRKEKRRLLKDMGRVRRRGADLETSGQLKGKGMTLSCFWRKMEVSHSSNPTTCSNLTKEIEKEEPSSHVVSSNKHKKTRKENILRVEKVVKSRKIPTPCHRGMGLSEFSLIKAGLI
ncbi:hypothetical protein ElyMa_000118400 [Elysia marginata]|uniref:Uncharacterized protein n=1 Tax=Elysia marginata TaxID=1093978 RepID=A0AAV4EML4_9GAST|nr:hypothetical protein ElyMa_000118400 [Elysia marginata]